MKISSRYIIVMFIDDRKKFYERNINFECVIYIYSFAEEVCILETKSFKCSLLGIIKSF